MLRRRLALTLALVAPGCGDTPTDKPRGPLGRGPSTVKVAGSPDESREEQVEPAPAPVDPARPPPRVDCPPGTEQRGAPPPEGRQVSCFIRHDDGTVVRTGPFRQWNEEGQLIVEGQYRKGEKDRRWTEYYPNGQRKHEASWRNGVFDGGWRSYYPDGRLQGEGRYRDGKKYGEARFYYEDGTLKAVGTYEDDVRVGTSKNYRPDGSLESEGPYVDGKKHGKWRTRLEDGTVVEETYADGIKVQEQ